MKAIITGLDTHPANSLALMLRSVGYDVAMLDNAAITELGKRGYTGGVFSGELQGMGYVAPNMPYVSLGNLDEADLFVDFKTKHLDSFKPLYPNLKVIHYLINGGADDYEGCGFEYPVVTSNMWVQGKAFKEWFPFDNVHNLQPREKRGDFDTPITLIHNVQNWGMGWLIKPLQDRLKGRLYGAWSPMGQIRNDRLGETFENALCNVHLKTNDCPGWALIETMMAGVPLVVPELMLDRMRMRPIYEDGVTCRTFGGKFYDKKVTQKTGVTKEWMWSHADEIMDEVVGIVDELRDPDYNHQIGMAGYERCVSLLEWTEAKRQRFAEFLEANDIRASL